MSSLHGRRVLVVGASSGIGAAFARAVVAAGGAVAVSARRADALAELVATMGTGHAVAGDVGVAPDAHRVASEAAAALGGIDLMFYAAGRGVLQRIEDIDPDVWIDLFRVNVVGANLVTSACLPYMHADGVCAYVSSRTVGDRNKYFAPYMVTKAALDQSIASWRVEHPHRRFVRVVMGNTQPTEFGSHMGDDELLAAAIDAWGDQAIPGGMMHVDDVAASLARSFATMLDHPSIDSSELKLDARP